MMTTRKERKAELKRLIEEYNRLLGDARAGGIEVPEGRYRVWFCSGKRATVMAVVGIVIFLISFFAYMPSASLVLAFVVAVFGIMGMGEDSLVWYDERSLASIQDRLVQYRRHKLEIEQMRAEQAELIRKLNALKPWVEEWPGYWDYGVYYSLKEGAYVRLGNYFDRRSVSEETYEKLVEKIVLETESEEQKRARRQELVKEFEESLKKEGQS